MNGRSATRIRTITGSVPSGVRPVVLVGAWLALTTLFTVGSVSVVLAVGTAVEQSLGVASFLLTLAAVMGACAVSPTVARTVLVAAVERFEAGVDRGVDAGSDCWPLRSCGTDEGGHCPTPCCS